MSLTPTKDLLAKSIQKSHSSSSLLLSSANLSWTPTSSAILVTPQPPVERTVTPPVSNEELIQSIRLDSKTNSNQSLDTLGDNFQTISLCDHKSDDKQCADTSDTTPVDSKAGQTSGLQKMSIIGQLFSGHSNASFALPSLSLLTASKPTTEPLSHTYDSTGISQPTAPTVSSLSYSTPDFNTGLTANTPVTTNSFTAQSLPISAPQPVPTAPPPPLPAPPKDAFVAKDYKIRGPLRLYDPNHGSNLVGTDPPDHISGQLPVPLDTPHTQSTPETLYNPNDYYTNSQSVDATNEQTFTYSAHQQYESTGSAVNASQPAIDSQLLNQFSFISDLQNTEHYYSSQQNPLESETPVPQMADPSPPLPEVQYPTYAPVVHHWFYQQIIENKEIWRPFSMYDSFNLEQSVLMAPNYGYGALIATNGGRFDVSIYERMRRPVYWQEMETIVRRCSWFYKKEGHNRWVPYTEDVSARLEECYKECVLTNSWNQTIELDSGAEVVVIHSANIIYNYVIDQSMPDGWRQAVDNPNKPIHVHRGALDGIVDDIDEGEPEQIDHVLFLIHGIGEFCDFSFRSIVEVVDDFRVISLNQMRRHFGQYLSTGQLGRIELLPISWHSSLHGEETGIDNRLKLITLESIPKLRHFSNDTILDALFYTSPVYSQTIVDNVGQELNRLFKLFTQRNPTFAGTVALGGHSLGSLIVFDILAHQMPEPSPEATADSHSETSETTTSATDEEEMVEYFSQPSNQSVDSLLRFLGFGEFNEFFASKQRLDFKSTLLLTESDFRSDPRLRELPIGLEKSLLKFIHVFNRFVNNGTKSANHWETESKNEVNYPFESLGLGYPAIKYPALAFKPSAFFAMGSPIPMFLTVRGVEHLSPDFRLPTCPAVYNIFHPYDPIAYRLEPMIYHSFKEIKPVLIPHHKGRKRMHYELRDSIARMGSDIKNRIYDSLKYTWNSINEFARAHKTATSAQSTGDSVANDYQCSQTDLFNDCSVTESESYGTELSAGALNSGRRIDYVLQESPVEAFNEYLFALSAHACYWQSEDTALLILRELYGQLGFYTTPTASPYHTQSTIPTSASVNSFDGQLFDDTNLQFISN